MALVNIGPHVIPHQKMHSIVSGNFLGGSKASPAACECKLPKNLTAMSAFTESRQITSYETKIVAN